MVHDTESFLCYNEIAKKVRVQTDGTKSGTPTEVVVRMGCPFV